MIMRFPFERKQDTNCSFIGAAVECVAAALLSLLKKNWWRKGRRKKEDMFQPQDHRDMKSHERLFLTKFIYCCWKLKEKKPNPKSED